MYQTDGDTPNGAEYDFVNWLKRNKLQSYQQALEEEGFEVQFSFIKI